MMKIKMVKTVATTGVIYNDNSSAIVNLETIGKLNLSKAKKFFKNDYQLANAKTLEVIAVEHETISYSIEDEKLHEFLKQNGTEIIDTENDEEISE